MNSGSDTSSTTEAGGTSGCPLLSRETVTTERPEKEKTIK